MCSRYSVWYLLTVRTRQLLGVEYSFGPALPLITELSIQIETRFNHYHRVSLLSQELAPNPIFLATQLLALLYISFPSLLSPTSLDNVELCC